VLCLGHVPVLSKNSSEAKSAQSGHLRSRHAVCFLPRCSRRRTGRESFPSSGSSRYKAPLKRSRCHDGLIPAGWQESPSFLENARSLKYDFHCGSNGLASFRILMRRRILVSPAYIRRAQTGLPSGVCWPVLVANVQARLRRAGKQCFLTQSRDFLGCRRLAHCQNRPSPHDGIRLSLMARERRNHYFVFE
jgi:hypothetical protein